MLHLTSRRYKLRKTHAYWETILSQNLSSKVVWILTDKFNFERQFVACISPRPKMWYGETLCSRKEVVVIPYIPQLFEMVFVSLCCVIIWVCLHTIFGPTFFYLQVPSEISVVCWWSLQKWCPCRLEVEVVRKSCPLGPLSSYKISKDLTFLELPRKYFHRSTENTFICIQFWLKLV